jgi:hypothetical protein
MKKPKGDAEDDILFRFVALFREKGWLDRKIKIKYNNFTYRIFCSDTEFLVYRLNDNAGVSPGSPGWPVCLVRQGRVFHDAEMCPFPSTEPDAGRWLSFIAEGALEAI